MNERLVTENWCITLTGEMANREEETKPAVDFGIPAAC
jgi:hypothetical protein